MRNKRRGCNDDIDCFGLFQKGKKEKELERELEQASAEMNIKEIQRLVRV